MHKQLCVLDSVRRHLSKGIPGYYDRHSKCLMPYNGFILAVKYFHENAPKFFSQMTHVDKRKVWKGNTHKINYCNKAEKHEIHENILLPK